MKQSVLNETSTLDHGILSDLFESDAQPISLSIICTLKKLLLIIRFIFYSSLVILDNF